MYRQERLKPRRIQGGIQRFQSLVITKIPKYDNHNTYLIIIVITDVFIHNVSMQIAVIN